MTSNVLYGMGGGSDATCESNDVIVNDFEELKLRVSWWRHRSPRDPTKKFITYFEDQENGSIVEVLLEKKCSVIILRLYV